MNMIVIPQDQIDIMVKIIDHITKHPYGKTVAWYKEHYNLTDEEYEMIFDLTMPFIRSNGARSYWRERYKNLMKDLRLWAKTHSKNIDPGLAFIINGESLNSIEKMQEEEIE